MLHRTCDWRKDTPSRKRPLRDSGKIKAYRGARFQFIRLGEGWVVTDLYPYDEDYIFRRGGKCIYVRKILLETTDRSVAEGYLKLAQRWDADWASGVNKIPETVDI